MKTVKLNTFEIFSLGWISFSLACIFLALTKLFCLIALIIILAIILATARILIKKKIVTIIGMKKSSWIILAVICALGIFLSIFTEPTIFGGRDEGSYAINAIMISKNNGSYHSNELVNQFYQIYGTGKALNFPGFYYDDSGALKSQFLPAYSSWLAIWYKFFGLAGLKFANLFPFITFLFSFYLILQGITRKITLLLTRKKIKFTISVIGLLLLATTFPILIFYKFTLGEIYFASLLWFAIYLFSRYTKDKSGFRYGLMIIPLAILPFARIEAFAFIFMFLFIFILKDYNHFKLPRYQLLFVVLGILFIVIFAYEPNFFLDSIKNILEPFLGTNGLTTKENSSLFSDDWQGLYSLKLFYNYNLLPIFIIGAAFLLNFLRKNEREKIKGKSFLIPLILFAPAFIYFIDANISLDHPWYFRRFVFAIIPVLVLYASLFLLQISLFRRWIFWPIIVLLILSNIFLFFPINQNGKLEKNFLVFGQNENLLAQTEEISKNFSENDLILVSQQSSGSGWSLMSEPLREIFDKQAVYFFNPKDLEKIEKSKFENIYLITSTEELALYEEINKKEIRKYEINNSIIRPSKKPQQKPGILETQVQTIIFQIE